MDRLEILDQASAGFARRLDPLPPGALGGPSTCGEWTVAELIGHVVGGNRMAAALIAGASAEEAMASLTGAAGEVDPSSAFAASAAVQAAAFATADLDAVVHHPAMDMPVAQLLGFRITDLCVHAWDLARSTGGDEALERPVLEAVWAAIEPMVPMMGAAGVFGSGASGRLGPDADIQLRVLDACGRRP